MHILVFSIIPQIQDIIQILIGLLVIDKFYIFKIFFSLSVISMIIKMIENRIKLKIGLARQI